MIFTGNASNNDVGVESASDQNSKKEGSACLKSLVDVYGSRMEKSQWASTDVYDSWKDKLSDMSLHVFGRHFRVSKYKQNRNKISYYQCPTVVVFYPRYPSSPSSDSYTSYCRVSLMKYKPWTRDDDSIWKENEPESANDDEHNRYNNTIRNAWDSWLEHMIVNDIPFPEELRCRMEEHINSGVGSTEDESGLGVPSVHHVNEGDGTANGNAIEGMDSLNTGDRLLRRFGFEQEDGFLRWDSDHNWNELVHEYPEDCTNSNVLEFYTRIVKSGCGESERRDILRSSLKNDEQRQAHDLCVRACLLEHNERISSTDGGDDIGRLQLVIGEGGTGKSYVIDAIVTTLIEKYGFNLSEIGIFAPTGMCHGFAVCILYIVKTS